MTTVLCSEENPCCDIYFDNVELAVEESDDTRGTSFHRVADGGMHGVDC